MCVCFAKQTDLLFVLRDSHGLPVLKRGVNGPGFLTKERFVVEKPKFSIVGGNTDPWIAHQTRVLKKNLFIGKSSHCEDFSEKKTTPTQKKERFVHEGVMFYGTGSGRAYCYLYSIVNELDRQRVGWLVDGEKQLDKMCRSEVNTWYKDPNSTDQSTDTFFIKWLHLIVDYQRDANHRPNFFQHDVQYGIFLFTLFHM